MKVVIINKSDTTGGAAVVSRRLMNALRRAGLDARMVVCEKIGDSPYVSLAASPTRIKFSFLAERLKIFFANGFNRQTLFKIDIASNGLPLYRHPWVKEADVICLNWINQGMLSLKGVERLLKEGKKVIWTMHDMWNMTGLCHHAGDCTQFITGECHKCPLLKKALVPSLAHIAWKRKQKLYKLAGKIQFVAVSHWLKERAAVSALLSDQAVTVIPNAFPFEKKMIKERISENNGNEEHKIRLLFGAARLDDPIKGLSTLMETTRILSAKYPEVARRLQLVTFGGMKNPQALALCSLSLDERGLITNQSEVRKLYEQCDIVISTSHYETLPGTLVEAQAFGCLPVAFDRGGQRDIIDDGETGLLVDWNDDPEKRSHSMAGAIVRAVEMMTDEANAAAIRKRMRERAFARFEESVVASRYISLFNQ